MFCASHQPSILRRARVELAPFMVQAKKKYFLLNKFQKYIKAGKFPNNSGSFILDMFCAAKRKRHAQLDIFCHQFTSIYRKLNQVSIEYYLELELKFEAEVKNIELRKPEQYFDTIYECNLCDSVVHPRIL